MNEIQSKEKHLNKLRHKKITPDLIALRKKYATPYGYFQIDASGTISTS